MTKNEAIEYTPEQKRDALELAIKAIPEAYSVKFVTYDSGFSKITKHVSENHAQAIAILEQLKDESGNQSSDVNPYDLHSVAMADRKRGKR